MRFVFRRGKNRTDRVMKNSTQKSIRNLSIAILVLGGLTLVYTYVQMISQLWLNNFIVPLTWNPEIKGWQIFILAARFIGITLLFALCCVFLYRTNKGLKVGALFPNPTSPSFVGRRLWRRFSPLSTATTTPW